MLSTRNTVLKIVRNGNLPVWPFSSSSAVLWPRLASSVTPLPNCQNGRPFRTWWSTSAVSLHMSSQPSLHPQPEDAPTNYARFFLWASCAGRTFSLALYFRDPSWKSFWKLTRGTCRHLLRSEVTWGNVVTRDTHRTRRNYWGWFLVSEVRMSSWAWSHMFCPS
jgi:hypothetical protein